MNQSITKHVIPNSPVSDDPRAFMENGIHYATIQAPIPFDSDTIAAFIMADIGCDLQHVHMDDHELYQHPVFKNVKMAFIDTDDETVYLVV